MKLHFVYNAEGGLLNGFLDSIHKAVSPQSYECSLCAITYGLVAMRPEWREWLRGAEIEAVFHHRADFRAAWPGIDVALPAILAERGGALAEIVGAAQLAQFKDVGELIAAIEPHVSAGADA